LVLVLRPVALVLVLTVTVLVLVLQGSYPYCLGPITALWVPSSFYCRSIGYPYSAFADISVSKQSCTLANCCISTLPYACKIGWINIQKALGNFVRCFKLFRESQLFTAIFTCHCFKGLALSWPWVMAEYWINWFWWF